MKHNKYPQAQKQTAASLPSPTTPSTLKSDPNDFVPSADEVARRAYFSYVNEGSTHGYHVQHWLMAEAELLAERNLTRAHGFHNQT